MSFGKHHGKKLDELPKQYLGWIIQNDIYRDHEDLAAALRARGHLESDFKATMPSREALNSFRAPKKAIKACFYNPWTHEQIWITISDAMRYFKVHPVSMKQGGLVPWGKSIKKWWLFQVYAYAEHIGTIGNPSQIAQALRAFLNKNQEREEEIMDRFRPNPTYFND